MAEDDKTPKKRLARLSDVVEESAQDATPVRKVPKRSRVQTGKPKRLPKTASMKAANYCGPGGGGGLGSYGISGGGGGGVGGHGIAEGLGGNFYSPELSTDFLELPQSLHENWNYYRFFYRTEPFVGQAIDVHTELPLSRVRIGTPQAKNTEMAMAAKRFCQKWARRTGLLQRLMEIVHEYHLIGEVFVFVEDTSPEMPQDVTHELVRFVDAEGLREEWVELPNADERAFRWMKKNYKGWTALRVLPPEQVHMESFNFTDERLFELIPDSKTKDLIQRAQAGDDRAAKIVESMDDEVIASVLEGKNIPLNTDPEAGSFVYYLSRKRSQYAGRGQSILERCIRTLVFRDKLRQANTSIASRHMTPIRVVWAEDMDAADVEALRDQVDMALMDPDFSIIANFQINWEEPKGERLLELSGEYDLTDRQLYAGLGVTESLLSGESAYSGDRINLEVLNTRYLLLREIIQEFVEEQIFKPMCARMGFIEIDEDGDEVVIYPSLSFSRLPIRDNADTFDAMFSLYQKGSLDVGTIYELLNLDPLTVNQNLLEDLWTIRDATANEAVRSVYSEVGRILAENSDATEIIADNFNLKFKKPEGGDERF